MKAYHILPDGYEEKFQMNLQKDKKTAMKINIGAFVLTVLLVLAGNFVVPIYVFVEVDTILGFCLRIGVLLLAYLAYIVLHELTHALVMKAVGGSHVRFGFTGLYAYAGSLEDYFDKSSYRYIALAPLVVWGIIFGVLTAVVPPVWFWIAWFLQIGNIGGAAGDLYVTARLWKEPESILVRDTGVDMTVFDVN